MPLPTFSPRSHNRQMLRKLLVVVVVMFAFGWSLIPLYEKICEVTGINVLARLDENLKGTTALPQNTQVDKSRLITVEFDANSQGAWRFRPVKNSIQVHPGELTTITYEVANQQNRTVAGQAIPGYLPLKSAEYFRKLTCFCFQQQTLGPNEARQFPVVFVVDPKLPKDVQRITLTYTFFEVAGATPKQAG
ncbi:cytochrome c oxidase assembly protein [Parvibium lacunae]|uniref:Cytochrome c oxidase assembly protein CtaG n=1 Tax=Parvibium lacunae TaxID=1888893 RepID=A0A368KZX9_9BURK|nr:cytochrome c oxidase assembly protein [Parvibium lacunae]RCS56850.1 cytochrome c oxidase assembly protein [Parvibium lacunae]